MEKIIRIGKHPYAFDIKVRFGTFDEMIANAKRVADWDGGVQVHLGGSFNKKMDSTRRASFLEIGVHYEKCSDVSNPKYGMITYATAISFCHWEGVYWKCSYFDEELKKGLFPISADWNGVTLIERGKDVNGRWVTHYEPTDTYRY